jgi:aspartate racemase
MQIGLIGGIGPAATDYYYRRLIAAFAGKKMPLELTIAHADTPTLLNNLASDDKAGQAAIFTYLTKRLAAAGANCVAITSIAGHFCIDAFKATSPLPAVDMIVEVNRAIAGRGLSRVGILGTRTVMETRDRLRRYSCRCHRAIGDRLMLRSAALMKNVCLLMLRVNQ